LPEQLACPVDERGGLSGHGPILPEPCDRNEC
jgi:hypothetical protein